MLAERKTRLAQYYIIAVVILLIFFHYAGFLSWPEKYFLGAIGTGQNKVYTFITKLKYSFVNYQEAQSLKTANEELKSQLNQLTFDNSQLEAYKLENEKLRALLSFKEDKKFDLVLANVIGKDPDRANTLIINRGTADGIKEGLAAITDEGVIIGKVAQAKDHLATILLLTDSLSKLAVSNQSINKLIGIAQGEYGLSLTVNTIPQDIDIQEGDIFITSGTEPGIPRGLIIGKVSRIISKANDIFKAAAVNLPVDYNGITLLSLVIPQESQ